MKFKTDIGWPRVLLVGTVALKCGPVQAVHRSRASLYGSVRTLFSQISHEAIYTKPETLLRRGC